MFGLNYFGFFIPNLSCQINLSWSIGVEGEKKIWQQYLCIADPYIEGVCGSVLFLHYQDDLY